MFFIATSIGPSSRTREPAPSPRLNDRAEGAVAVLVDAVADQERRTAVLEGEDRPGSRGAIVTIGRS